MARYSLKLLYVTTATFGPSNSKCKPVFKTFLSKVMDVFQMHLYMSRAGITVHDKASSNIHTAKVFQITGNKSKIVLLCH